MAPRLALRGSPLLPLLLTLPLLLAACPDEGGPTPGPTTDIAADPGVGGDVGVDAGTDPGTPGDVAVDPGPGSDGGGEDALADGGGEDAAVADTGLEDAAATDAGGDVALPDAGGDVGPGDAGGDTGTDELWNVASCPLDLPVPANGATCEVTAGNANLLIRGQLLLPDGLQRVGELLVEGDSITCIGCECSTRPAAIDATVVTCPKGLVSPGLINAHDHITFSQQGPVGHGEVRYDHRHEWRKGKNGLPKIPYEQNWHALGDGWVEMRQIMAGTTSMFGSGAEGGFMRNLDRGNRLEGLSHPNGDYSTFPLGDSGGTIYDSGCSGYNPDDPFQAAQESAYVPHVAEGIADGARNEFVCSTGQAPSTWDFVLDNAAFIHGIGLTTADIGLMAADGTGLIWSPRSNTDLYGFTANAPVYDRLGALIGLGSDWTPSGSMTMLRELACAERWNDVHWEGHFSERDLVDMVTFNNAELLGFADVMGSLTVGKVADIAIWDAGDNEAYRAILDAGVEDVALVLRGGLPLYGDADVLFATTKPGDCEVVDVCGVGKRLCAQRELGISYAQLSQEIDAGHNNTTYPLFMCGVPQDEPSCVPFRPDEFTGVPSDGDPDGDGVATADDNCPATFNAPRPVDGMVQVDVDEDGLGDECDPCPFDADTEACSSIDPLDIDADMIPIPADNCPTVPNPDQADADGDGTGDVCDDCPDFANPAGAPCPATIYDVKTGAIGVGEGVLLSGVLVTSSTSSAFTVQHDPQAADYAGAEYSGVYAYHPGGSAPPVGAKVDIAATVGNYYGQIQLINATITVVDPAAGAPAPAVVDPADLITPAATSEAWEAMLVRVVDVEVTDVAPAGEPNETVTGEFEVAGGLPVDDGFYLIDPFPSLGQVLPGITGVIRFNWNRNKLLPRSLEDVALGPPYLLDFGPASGSVIYETVQGAAIPTLEVRLSNPGDSDLFVAVTSADPDAVDVLGGGVTVPAGELTAEVQLDAKVPGGPVTLTATLDDVSLDAAVTVLDLATAPVPLAVDPPTAFAVFDQAVTFTVTLDRPAPPGGQVVAIALSGVAATADAELTVAEGSFEGTFVVTAGAVEGDVTVSVSVGGVDVPTPAVLTIQEQALYGMLLVEVLYDVSGSDDGKEWVKLYNGSGGPIDLAGWSLGWGGGNYVWGTAQLGGVVPAGACFFVGGPTSDASNFTPDFSDGSGFVVNFTDDIQNSGGATSSGDGLALFNVPATELTATTVPVDAVVYGSNNDANLLMPTDDGSQVPFPGALVGDAPANSSLLRTGIDTWEISGSPNSTGCTPIQ